MSHNLREALLALCLISPLPPPVPCSCSTPWYGVLRQSEQRKDLSDNMGLVKAIALVHQTASRSLESHRRSNPSQQRAYTNLSYQACRDSILPEEAEAHVKETKSRFNLSFYFPRTVGKQVDATNTVFALPKLVKTTNSTNE